MSETTTPAKEPRASSETMSRATAILAVIAAIASARWGACNLQAILEQGKVNDTWAYYQAKSIKQHEAEQSRDLSAALASHQTGDAAEALNKLQQKMSAEARRQETEKIQRALQAEAYQLSRDHMVESSFWFELAFAGLQLGVILCTIAAGGKREAPFIAGIVFGVLGALLLVNGFHRFVHAPAGWYQGAKEQIASDIEPTTAPSQQP